MKSTPVAATRPTLSRLMPPEASRIDPARGGLHRPGQGGFVHVIQQDDIRARGDGLLQAGQVRDLHFNLQGMGRALFGQPDGRRRCPRPR